MCYSTKVNGQILSLLFQEREKHEIWHKDAFRGGEFKLMGKLMSELFQGEFSFSAHMFACKDENLKFFSLQVHNLSHTIRQTTRKRKE